MAASDTKGASGYKVGRNSGMSNSSMNSAPKKGGAGGNYTWGGELDVIDYVSVGAPSAGVYTSSVGPTLAAPVVVNGSVPVFSDQSAFPILGATVQPRVATTWGPGAAATILSPTNLRTGAVDMVGASHPRNLFARKPTVRSATTVVSAAPERQIDWSSQGMPTALVSAVLQATPSHRGPYVTQSVPIAQETLLARNIGTQQVIRATQPQVTKASVGPSKVEMKSRRLC